MAQLDDVFAHVYVRGAVRALLCTGIGDTEAAFRHLEQVLDERSPGVIYLHLDPLLDSLRDDPPLPGLLRRIGVAD